MTNNPVSVVIKILPAAARPSSAAAPAARYVLVPGKLFCGDHGPRR